jgi:hypothetical protein
MATSVATDPGPFFVHANDAMLVLDTTNEFTVMHANNEFKVSVLLLSYGVVNLAIDAVDNCRACARRRLRSVRGSFASFRRHQHTLLRASHQQSVRQTLRVLASFVLAALSALSVLLPRRSHQLFARKRLSISSSVFLAACFTIHWGKPIISTN